MLDHLGHAARVQRYRCYSTKISVEVHSVFIQFASCGEFLQVAVDPFHQRFSITWAQWGAGFSKSGLSHGTCLVPLQASRISAMAASSYPAPVATAIAGFE